MGLDVCVCALVSEKESANEVGCGTYIMDPPCELTVRMLFAIVMGMAGIVSE